MSKIDIDRLVCDLVEVHARITGIDRDLVSTYLDDALALQGLRVKDGKLVRISGDSPDVVGMRFAKEAIEYCNGNKGADARVRAGFIVGAEYGYKFAIDKACEWLSLHDNHASTSVFLDKFRKAMDEKQ